MKKAIFLVFLIVLIGGCVGGTQQKKIEENAAKTKIEVAVDACKAECQKAIEDGTDLSNGPCLSNSIADDWVCDVAHSPREYGDNQPENQCSAFRAGEANHFVELDENCGLIKVR